MAEGLDFDLDLDFDFDLDLVFDLDLDLDVFLDPDHVFERDLDFLLDLCLGLLLRLDFFFWVELVDLLLGDLDELLLVGYLIESERSRRISCISLILSRIAVSLLFDYASNFISLTIASRLFEKLCTRFWKCKLDWLCDYECEATCKLFVSHRLSFIYCLSWLKRLAYLALISLNAAFIFLGPNA